MASIFGTTKHKIELNNDWLVYQSNNKEKIKATVPGHIQYDMFKSGLLPDPFVGRNCELWKEACEKDYTYSLKFDVPKQLIDNKNVELVFEGIDTVALVKLNGIVIGTTDNMFKTWRFNVKDYVKEKNNELKVLIKNPIEAARTIREKYKKSSKLLNHEVKEFFGQKPPIQNYIRKAACSFGWDWGPELPISGIWKPVYIEGWSDTRIKLITVESKVSPDKQRAEVLGYIKFTDRVEEKSKIEIKLTLPVGRELIINRDLLPEAQNASFKFIVDNPPLWWPNGLGEQPLCKLTAKLKKSNKIVSTISRRVGIRQLDVIIEPDKFGTSFFIRVNGVNVFAKGGNWIPADALTSRLTDADYKRLISDAAKANMNILRVWGGGYYENDIFYDLCDEYGILVWQDLMFACIIYPCYKEFLLSVADELNDNICRLQTHPSIALWCGNNEIEMIVLHYRKVPKEDARDYFYMFDEYLRGVVNSLDNTRLYWPSSPHTPFSNNTDEESGGDTHFWGVWHSGMPLDSYAKRYDRFMSEFGYQSFPDIHTIKSFANDNEYDINSATMQYHQKNGGGNARIMEDVIKNIGEPKSFEHFLIMSQFLQMNVIKTGVEHWRANRIENRCMGTIVWQFNDNWPVVSWASVDYYGRWKALHYAEKRFYAPIFITLVKYDNELKVTVVNDLADEIIGKVVLKLNTYSGKTVYKESMKVKVNPCDAKIIFLKEINDILGNTEKNKCYFSAEFISEKFISNNIFHFSTLKNAKLINPNLSLNLLSNDKIIVTAKEFAECIYLYCEDANAQFSDNYFNLLPNESKVVKLLPVKSDKKIKVTAYKSVKTISAFDLK